MKLKLLTFALLAIFSSYFALTVLFVTPNNYVRIQAMSVLEVFETFFSQQWNFFAPPPKFNTRLYLIFADENETELKVVEVLQPITEQKRKKAPFNATEEALDYALFGCISNITNSYKQELQMAQVLFPDSSETFHQDIVLRGIQNSSTQLPAYATLVNYARIVALRSGLLANHPGKLKVKMRFIAEDLPKFIHREELLKSPEEASPTDRNLMYYSPYIDL